MMHLPNAFLQAPIAHRGLHDENAQRAENSRAAILAAVQRSYGIEINLQLTSDGQAIVFHDYALDRMTGQTGFVNRHSAADLSAITLDNSGGETLPTLIEILDLIDEKAPLLIELKDQDGQMGARVGRLERATAQALKTYQGLVAVMSFNPHSVLQMASLAPDLPRGLITEAFTAEEWPMLPAGTRDRLRGIPDYRPTKSCFISHDVDDLERARVAELKAQGASVLSWTIRSTAIEAAARDIADNITFEGYHPTRHP